jgi:hypothetical protein
MDEATSVADILRSIDASLMTGDYTLAYYEQVFMDFPLQAREWITATNDSIVLRLENGQILNLTYRRLSPEIGARSFDMPLLEKDVWSGQYDHASWFVQPPGHSPVSESDLLSFVAELNEAGYRFSAPDRHKLAYYDGAVKLLDPFAVVKNVRSIPDVLWSLDERSVKHNLELYQQLFADFPMRMREYVTSGHNSIVLRLENGNLFKTSKLELPDEAGTRPWDMPIIEKGIVQSARYSLVWYIQPEGETPIADRDLMPFLKELRADGYRFTQPGLDQLAYYHGKVRLLDPFAVSKIPGNT